MEKITYITCFGSLGYYASYQPNYEWSFTNDIQNALEYKTLNGALERLFWKGIESTHLYGGKDRTIVEKTSVVIINGNTTNITSTTKNLTFEECSTLYKKYQDDKFKKRVEKFNRETEIRSRVNEKERIKWQKAIDACKQKQEEFYLPKCSEIQKLLNTPEYVSKRQKLLLTVYDEKNYTSFYEAYKNDNFSKYYTLFLLFNTMKILFDNNQEFILTDNKILINNLELEKTRSIFMNNGVFKKDYCHFDREDLFKY